MHPPFDPNDDELNEWESAEDPPSDEPDESEESGEWWNSEELDVDSDDPPEEDDYSEDSFP